MVIADIITEFGAYYMNGGQNTSRLYKLLNTPSVTEQQLTQVVTDDTLWRASKASIGRLIQPFQKAWTPTGEATFTPLSIQNFKFKIDMEEYPDDLEATWLGFLAGNGLDRKQWPFVRYMIEQLAVPQMHEDFELNEIFAGQYVAPASGTPGLGGTSMDGLRVKRNRAISSSKAQVISLGALSTDPKTFVGQIETFVDAINTKYWSIPMQLNMSEVLERRFKRGYEDLYGTYTNYKDNPQNRVKFANITIVGLPSHNGSDVLWCTPKSNAIKLNKKTQNMGNFMIENVDRKVKLFTDWWNGVGFILEEILFTNELDTGAPTISAVSPLVGGTAGGTSITITGTDFIKATAVKFGGANGTDATSFTVNSDKQIVAVTPALSAGNYTAAVVNEFGNAVSSSDIVIS